MKKKYTYAVCLVLIILSCLPFLFLDLGQGGISGSVTVTDMTPKGFVFVPPDDQSPEAAISALEQAKQEIKETKGLGFLTEFADDTLVEAEQSYREGNLSQVFKLTQLISYTKKEKINIFDKIKLIEIKKQSLEEQGISVKSEINNLIDELVTAFNLDRFGEAETLINQINQALDDTRTEYSRLKVLTFLKENFFSRYWRQIILSSSILVLVLFLLVRKIGKKRLQKKISNLKLEFKKTKQLIKQLQKDCFVDKKITLKEYKGKAAKYEDCMAEIKQAIPVLEAQIKKEKIKEQKKEGGKK